MEASSVLAFSTLKTGVLPRLTTWVGPLTGAAGLVSRNDLADHQVVKEHFDGCQVLLGRLRRTRVLFDIGRNVHRRDEPKIVNMILAPGQKLAAGASVRFASVQVPDPGREKFQELGRRVLAGVGENCWNGMRVAQG